MNKINSLILFATMFLIQFGSVLNAAEAGKPADSAKPAHSSSPSTLPSLTMGLEEEQGDSKASAANMQTRTEEEEKRSADSKRGNDQSLEYTAIPAQSTKETEMNQGAWGTFKAVTKRATKGLASRISSNRNGLIIGTLGTAVTYSIYSKLSQKNNVNLNVADNIVNGHQGQVFNAMKVGAPVTLAGSYLYLRSCYNKFDKDLKKVKGIESAIAPKSNLSLITNISTQNDLSDGIGGFTKGNIWNSVNLLSQDKSWASPIDIIINKQVQDVISENLRKRNIYIIGSLPGAAATGIGILPFKDINQAALWKKGPKLTIDAIEIIIKQLAQELSQLKVYMKEISVFAANCGNPKLDLTKNFIWASRQYYSINKSVLDQRAQKLLNANGYQVLDVNTLNIFDTNDFANIEGSFKALCKKQPILSFSGACAEIFANIWFTSSPVAILFDESLNVFSKVVMTYAKLKAVHDIFEKELIAAQNAAGATPGAVSYGANIAKDMDPIFKVLNSLIAPTNQTRQPGIMDVRDGASLEAEFNKFYNAHGAAIKQLYNENNLNAARKQLGEIQKTLAQRFQVAVLNELTFIRTHLEAFKDIALNVIIEYRQPQAPNRMDYI